MSIVYRITLGILLLAGAGSASAQVPSAVKIDPVTFSADQFACDLEIDGKSSGHLVPGKPVTINLPRKVEYLVECESHEIPVKLYARFYLTAPRFGSGGALVPKVTLLPLAVLPNVIDASSEPGMEVTAISTVKSVGCKVSGGAGFGLREGKPTVPTAVRTIAAGTKVKPTRSEPIHCGDTNLVELQGPDWKAWFPNRSFQFSYRGRRITLFEPSQDATCCWIS